MRTNVTQQFRSRERKCMGTKRPGTMATDTVLPRVLRIMDVSQRRSVASTINSTKISVRCAESL